MAGEQLQILATKVVPPRCGAGLIDRHRLLGLVGQVQGKQVSMIKAGAGFGKTSLAIAWAEALQRRGHVVAWLALDSDDDEPVRFFFYMGHALRRASDAVGTSAIDLLSEMSLAPPKTVAAALINDLADVENEIFLFLDDFHHITDPEVRNGLAYFLKYAPSQFHLIEGSPLGPDLTRDKWLWGDGSLASITSTITAGVPKPKEYGAPVPPMGGAELSQDQVSAVSAYVWALSHRSGG